MHCLYFKATADRVQRRAVGRGGKAFGALGRARNRPGDSNCISSIKIHKTRSRYINCFYRFTAARSRARSTERSRVRCAAIWRTFLLVSCRTRAETEDLAYQLEVDVKRCEHTSGSGEDWEIRGQEIRPGNRAAIQRS